MSISSLPLHLWYEFVWRTAARVYFNRITVVHAERLPRSGPVLYLGLHRNGAVDGFVYHRVVPRAIFMISTQLRRSIVGRLFFRGIEVVRDKDRERPAADRVQNRAALETCLRMLKNGGELFVLPEGTSDLGPRHLPFRRGAAQIAYAYLERSDDLAIVPLGIHYEAGWAFRSNVEIVVGHRIDTTLLQAGARENVRTLHERFTRALEQVGINVADAGEQTLVERLAYAATLGTGHTYFDALKCFERGIPEPVASAWVRLESAASGCGLLRHQGVPLLPVAREWLYVLMLAPLVVITAAALLLNLPPLVLVVLAAKRFADARNVIALWRILLGLPVFTLWVIVVATIAGMHDVPEVFIVYAATTAAAVACWYRTKKLFVSVYNLVRGRRVRADLLELHALLGRTVSNAT